MQSVNNFKFKSIPLDLSGISFDMAEGSLTEIKEIFFIEGKYAPIIRWCSFSQNDWPKPHQIICDFWRNHGTVDSFTLDKFDADVKLSKVKPYVAYISQNNNDYRYDFVGDNYAKFHGLDVKKQNTLLDALNKSQSAIDLFNYTTLAATAIRGQCLLSLYQGGSDTIPELWNKLILPLVNKAGITEKFIVCALKSPAN